MSSFAAAREDRVAMGEGNITVIIILVKWMWTGHQDI